MLWFRIAKTDPKKHRNWLSVTYKKLQPFERTVFPNIELLSHYGNRIRGANTVILPSFNHYLLGTDVFDFWYGNHGYSEE